MKTFVHPFQIALHVFLIVWGCGLGPLAYFERLSAHRGVQAGNITILGVHVGQNPTLPPEIEAIVYRRSVSMRPQMLRRLQAKQHVPSLTQTERSPLKTLLTALTSSELLHTHSTPYVLLAIKLPRADQRQLANASADLSPPKKPPSYVAG